MGGEEMGKMDVKVTVMLDDETMAALSPVLVGSDVNLSQLIRSCIHTALPLLVARPALISILPTLPAAVDRENTR